MDMQQQHQIFILDLFSISVLKENTRQCQGVRGASQPIPDRGHQISGLLNTTDYVDQSAGKQRQKWYYQVQAVCRDGRISAPPVPVKQK